MTDYLNIFVYLCFSSVLSLIISGLAFVTAVRKPDPEKLSAYECGFDPFDSARSQFDIHFYLVAILFIIFDLEITFLFPWCISLGQIGIEGYFVMMVFLIVLTIGFIYEWLKTALEFGEAQANSSAKA